MFHEIDQDKIDRVRGFDITVVTTAKNDDEGRALLKQLGFPFQSADRKLNPGCRELEFAASDPVQASARPHHRSSLV